MVGIFVIIDGIIGESSGLSKLSEKLKEKYLVVVNVPSNKIDDILLRSASLEEAMKEILEKCIFWEVGMAENCEKLEIAKASGQKIEVVIAGYSYGGWLAYLLARYLQKNSPIKSHLLILDTPPAPYFKFNSGCPVILDTIADALLVAAMLSFYKEFTLSREEKKSLLDLDPLPFSEEKDSQFRQIVEILMRKANEIVDESQIAPARERFIKFSNLILKKLQLLHKSINALTPRQQCEVEKVLVVSCEGTKQAATQVCDEEYDIATQWSDYVQGNINKFELSGKHGNFLEVEANCEMLVEKIVENFGCREGSALRPRRS